MFIKLTFSKCYVFIIHTSLVDASHTETKDHLFEIFFNARATDIILKTQTGCDVDRGRVIKERRAAAP